MMRTRSKKGLTLVELAICCAITLLLGGACLSLLLSGRSLFDKGAQSANSTMETDILQTFMMQQLPAAMEIEQITDRDSVQPSTASTLSVEDGALVICRNGTEIQLSTITELHYTIIRAGISASHTAAPQLCYTVHFKDGSSFNAGFVLVNMKYDAAMDTLQGSLSENPLRIYPARAGT